MSGVLLPITTIYVKPCLVHHCTYGIPVYYIPALLQLAPGFARCRMAHRQMEEDWCNFLNVSELLRHKLRCILPI